MFGPYHRTGTSVLLWVVVTSACLRPVWQDGVTCLLWPAGSRYIATGCVDGKVRIWDSLSGDCAKIFCGHAGPIQSIDASSNGEFLVSVSVDGTARVFEIAEFR